MKQFSLAVLLSIMTMAAHAADGLIKFDVTIIKNGSPISQSSIITENGQAVPIESSTVHSYRAQASRENGKDKITPGSVKTGLVAIFKPEIQSNGQIKADVLIDVSELVAMRKLTSGDGLTIDMPEVKQTHLNQNVTFNANSPVTVLRSGDYTINISAKSF